MQVYWLWLALKSKMPMKDKLALLERVPCAEDIFYLKEKDYIALGCSKDAVTDLGDKSLKKAESVLADCRRKGIKLLTFGDPLYPNRLKNIYDPPLVLYYKGDLPTFDVLPAIGVVGTREASAYGLSVAQKLGTEIAACGGLVVSGMAKGVDAMATHGALLQSSFAVGVLGCGVDRVYPACNAQLFRRMERSGCLISEYPPGAKPDKWNFPQRNRIISGLSCGIVVVEAPMKSGSLITARQALEQGRDVFVVPGNVDIPTFQGSYELLREGATAVSSGWEILSEYASVFPEIISQAVSDEQDTVIIDKIAVDNKPKPSYSDVEISGEDLTGEEKAILSSIQGEQWMDHLIASSGLSASDAMAAITLLEIKGLVAILPGGRVIRK